MVPQWPEEAAYNGDRGVQRLQVKKTDCSELGGCKIVLGRKICDEKWIRVCLFIVIDHGTSGEVNVMSLLASSALLHASVCGIGCWDYGFPSPGISNAFGGTGVLVKLVKAEKSQAKKCRDIVP